ncbi:hypothetical protein [Parvularcula maris]|uniref:Uncharacterized protein n=1 Tax=Parvularcula maris TaxID=2965077 RepID=A0A9X2L9M5_9PROT|nr:hypothetical protein [Parvularcula maris]MCQ8185629.1 hypothetical protein [Parvularcula maris]
MRAAKAIIPLTATVLLTGCAVTKPIKAVGNAALRAGGMTPASDQKAGATAEVDKPHWSESWVWEGDGH